MHEVMDVVGFGLWCLPTVVVWVVELCRRRGVLRRLRRRGVVKWDDRCWMWLREGKGGVWEWDVD